MIYIYIITFIQYSNKGQINLSLISKHDEMNMINLYSQFKINMLQNTIDKINVRNFIRNSKLYVIQEQFRICLKKK